MNAIQSIEKRLALLLVVLILAHELKIEDANASLFEAKFYPKLLSFKLL
ncbi:hypothetical protein IC582_016210 [Cucumis melo]